MKVKNIGSNTTEVDAKVGTILISYGTPVAARMSDGSGPYRTAKKWSQTTSKHINKWLAGSNAEEKPQEFFDNLI